MAVGDMTNVDAAMDWLVSTQPALGEPVTLTASRTRSLPT
jgi:hypothetical protein